MKRIGIHELRRNLRSYPRRVAAGERIIVTDRNKPVAVLGPPQADTPWQELLARYGLRAPQVDLLDLAAPEPADAPRALAEALDEQRAERF